MSPRSVGPAGGSDDARIGSILADRYRIQALLGEGGMGRVYLAEHVLMKKRLAVKVLRRELTSVPDVVARFEREAMAAANVDHPNVAAATDFGKLADGSVFLVLEYVQGKSLRDEIAKGPFAVARALGIARQIAGGLGAAHQQGIVHRDLKPENVMLVDKGGDANFVKVLDFGIAKVPTSEIPNPESSSGGFITKAGMVFGTPEYMPPEQALGNVVDGRADLYSLGVILYEMLAGVRPFVSQSTVGIIGQQLSRRAPSISARAPGLLIPPGVEQIAQRLLEREPEARYALASDVVRAIDLLLTPMPGPGTYQKTPSPEWLDSGNAPTLQVSLDSLALPGAHERASPGSGAGAVDAVSAAGEADLRAGAKTPSPDDIVTRFTPARPTRSARLAVWFDALFRSVERARGSWPPPMRRAFARISSRSLVLGSALLLFLLVLSGVLVSAGLARGLRRSAPESNAALRGSSSVASRIETPPTLAAGPSASAAGVSERVGQTADNSGSAALAQLSRKFPGDAALLVELARAYFVEQEPNQGLAALTRALHLDPKLAQNETVSRLLFQAAQLKPTSDTTFALLESKTLGSSGADVIYDLSNSEAVKPGVRARATQWLHSTAFDRQSSPALDAVVALRFAQGCPQKFALLLRVKNVGDQRSLPYLDSLKSTSGCGRDQASDCFPCLRADSRLDDAISAVNARAKH